MERLAESLGLPEIMRVRATTLCVQRAKDWPLRGTQLGQRDKGKGVKQAQFSKIRATQSSKSTPVTSLHRTHVAEIGVRSCGTWTE